MLSISPFCLRSSRCSSSVLPIPLTRIIGKLSVVTSYVGSCMEIVGVRHTFCEAQSFFNNFIFIYFLINCLLSIQQRYIFSLWHG